MSRPASGEKTSSYGDSDSVGTGSIRPTSAASGSITGDILLLLLLRRPGLLLHLLLMILMSDIMISFVGSRASMFTMKSSSLDEMPPGEEKDEKSSEEVSESDKERILGVCVNCN